MYGWVRGSGAMFCCGEGKGIDFSNLGPVDSDLYVLKISSGLFSLCFISFFGLTATLCVLKFKVLKNFFSSCGLTATLCGIWQFKYFKKSPQMKEKSVFLVVFSAVEGKGERWGRLDYLDPT